MRQSVFRTEESESGWVGDPSDLITRLTAAPSTQGAREGWAAIGNCGRLRRCGIRAAAGRVARGCGHFGVCRAGVRVIARGGFQEVGEVAFLIGAGGGS